MRWAKVDGPLTLSLSEAPSKTPWVDWPLFALTTLSHSPVRELMPLRTWRRHVKEMGIRDKSSTVWSVPDGRWMLPDTCWWWCCVVGQLTIGHPTVYRRQRWPFGINVSDDSGESTCAFCNRLWTSWMADDSKDQPSMSANRSSLDERALRC